MHDDLPAIGATVGPWRILERFDSGSFGVVYRAQRADLPDSSPVALKIARQPGDPRFEREAEVLQRSHHPSIPRYEGKGVWTGPDGHDYPYLVMEWVQGSTLYPWFQEHLRSSLDVLQVAAQLAGALAFVHDRGVIHRDVKGANIRVTPEGRAVLLDWGSCWLPTARLITDTLLPPGTSAYRAPEQREFMYRFRKDTEARWESRPSDDLYALGTTLYRLVTGTYLPPCTDGAGLVARHVLRPSAMATVSPALEALVLRLIADAPKARGTAEQLMREALTLAQAGGASLNEPIRAIASAAPAESGGPSSDGQDDEPVSGESDTVPRPVLPPSRNEHQHSDTIPVWLTWAGASALGAGLMALLVLFLVRPPSTEEDRRPWIAPPVEESQFAPDAGVGDESLASFQEVPRATVPLYVLGMPMPKTPFPAQRRPPCVDPEIQRVINGGCWVAIKGKEPPCGKSAVDYGDECLMPVYDAPRSPTSEEP
jgi:serine/threonine protein kinase